MNISRIKTIKRGIVIFLAIIAIILFSNVPKAIAGDYLGEFCWLFQKTEDEHGPKVEGPFLMRAGVTYMGGAYYTLQGVLDAPSGPSILNGGAVIVGNEVLVTANESHDHGLTKPYRDSGIVQMRINLSNLNGSWWNVRNDFDTLTRSFNDGYAAGTVTFTTCP